MAMNVARRQAMSRLQMARKAITPIVVWAAILCLAYVTHSWCTDNASMAKGLQHGRTTWPLLVGGLFVAAIVTYVRFRIQLRQAARSELMKRGVVTTARILEIKDRGNGREDSTYGNVEVVVEFKTAAGVEVRSKGRFALGYVHAPRCQPGRSVQVWYDRKDPARIAIEDVL
jgi:hypothetical protein